MQPSHAAVVDRELSGSGQREFIVLATAVAGAGGIQRVTRMLIRALCEEYGEAHVHVLSVRHDDDGRTAEEPPFVASPGTGVSLSTQTGYLMRALQIARPFRKTDLMVVACHVRLAPVAWTVASASGAAYAIWCHGIEAWGSLSPLCRLALRRASVVFAPSRFSARAVERAGGLAKGTIKVLPHALSPEMPLRGEEQRNPTVCTLSRLAPADAYKGVDVLIRAWPLVLGAVPGARLVVVGDGADRSRLAALADALDVTHRVHFTGAVSDGELAVIFARAQVFALPSRTHLGANPQGEGFGLACLEASAAGLPVVAGQGGAAEEVVPDGVSALLVDPRDERLVAGAIARLLTDPALARRLGANGQTRAAQLFSFVAFREAMAGLLGGVRKQRLESPCAESSAR